MLHAAGTDVSIPQRTTARNTLHPDNTGIAAEFPANPVVRSAGPAELRQNRD
jgi:hypothetical protein